MIDEKFFRMTRRKFAGGNVTLYPTGLLSGVSITAVGFCPLAVPPLLKRASRIFDKSGAKRAVKQGVVNLPTTPRYCGQFILTKGEWKQKSKRIAGFSFVCLLAGNKKTATFVFYQEQKQTRCTLYIVDIAGTQEQFNRSAVLIDGGMNFWY